MRQDGLAGTVTADLEYPPRVAFVLLTQASPRPFCHTFNCEQLIVALWRVIVAIIPLTTARCRWEYDGNLERRQ